MSKSLPNLEPRARISDLDHVYSQLSRSIMMGEFEPGQKLKLQDLAAAFRTSHMPVREALSRLTVNKVLVAEPRKSACVPQMDQKRLLDLLEIRISLEKMALAKAVSSKSDDLVVNLKKINRQLEAEAESDRPDLREYLAANHRFHFSIYERCGNPDLTSLIELMWLRYGPFLHFIRRGADNIGRHENHAQIIDGIEHGRVTECCDALERDLREAASLISEMLPPSNPTNE